MGRNLSELTTGTESREEDGGSEDNVTMLLRDFEGLVVAFDWQRSSDLNNHLATVDGGVDRARTVSLLCRQKKEASLFI